VVKSLPASCDDERWLEGNGIVLSATRRDMSKASTNQREDSAHFSVGKSPLLFLHHASTHPLYPEDYKL
jgi:hypothetical protein